MSTDEENYKRFHRHVSKRTMDTIRKGIAKYCISINNTFLHEYAEQLNDTILTVYLGFEYEHHSSLYALDNVYIRVHDSFTESKSIYICTGSREDLEPVWPHISCIGQLMKLLEYEYEYD